jgi:hypothetical protein
MVNHFKKLFILLILLIWLLPVQAQSVSRIEIQDFELLPNPFSPLLANPNDPQGRRGQIIQLNLISPSSENPFISLKIYNMDGELIRTLKDNEPSMKQVQLIWDGKTNNGRYVRNGRYLVYLKVKDSTGEKEELKSTVLIK